MLDTLEREEVLVPIATAFPDDCTKSKVVYGEYPAGLSSSGLGSLCVVLVPPARSFLSRFSYVPGVAISCSLALLPPHSKISSRQKVMESSRDQGDVSPSQAPMRLLPLLFAEDTPWEKQCSNTQSCVMGEESGL